MICVSSSAAELETGTVVRAGIGDLSRIASGLRSCLGGVLTARLVVATTELPG
jgi:hypothetical protein